MSTWQLKLGTDGQAERNGYFTTTVHVANATKSDVLRTVALTGNSRRLVDISWQLLSGVVWRDVVAGVYFLTFAYEARGGPEEPHKYDYRYCGAAQPPTTAQITAEPVTSAISA
jgi:hypothetical protein